MNEEYEKALGDNDFLHLAIIFPGGNNNKITVIDNQFEWELDDFCRFGTTLFYDLDEAIEKCKKVAEKLNLKYIPFDSRYCKFKEVSVDGINLTMEEMDRMLED